MHDGVRNEGKMGMGRRGVSFMENGREWRLPGLLYADDLVPDFIKNSPLWLPSDTAMVCI